MVWSWTVELGGDAVVAAGDGDYGQPQAEVGRVPEQAEVADRLFVQVADRTGAGLLLAAGGAPGAGFLSDADAVDGRRGLSQSSQALGGRALLGAGRLRGGAGERSSGFTLDFAWSSIGQAFARLGSRGGVVSSFRIWGAQYSLGPITGMLGRVGIFQ